MNSLKSAFPNSGAPGALSSGLRQWVELDPTNGGVDNAIDGPDASAADATECTVPRGADTERPAG